MSDNIAKMLELRTWAVVGVTPKQEKFGYKIWKRLKNNGYDVYAVNPNYKEIEGEPCYASLADLPVKPDVIDFVVPPSVTLQTIEEAHKLGIKNLWFQPGTYDEEVTARAKELGMNTVYNCVLVQLPEGQ